MGPIASIAVHLSIVGAALFGTIAPATPSAPSELERTQQRRETDGSRLVKVALLTDTTAVRPGETFQLAVKLDVRERWHIYWENAGDAGTPTRAWITGPEGFEIGAVRFPTPHRREEEGDIVAYVHEGEVVLLAQVKAPSVIAPDAKLRFGVECDWLVCTDYCLAGSGKAKLELPLAAADAPRANANEPLFRAANAKLPGDWKAVAGEGAKLAIESRPEARAFHVTITVPGADALEFFPAAQSKAKLVKRSVATVESGLRLELEMERAEGATLDDVRGVLSIRRGTSESSCLVENPDGGKR